MAESSDPRFGGHRWTADSDTWDRSEIDGSLNAIYTQAAMYATGTRAARPVPGKVGRLYRATDTGALFWDDGTNWQDAEGRAVTATWTPQAWSGASAASAWTNSGGFTAGSYVLDARGWLDGNGMVDLGDNGPTFATAGAPAYVSAPVAPIGIQSGQDLGGWVWADASGNPVLSGRLAWNGSVNKVALVSPNGYAQIATSYRYRLSYSLSYRVA